MKPILLAALMTAAATQLVLAQSQSECTACISATGCDARRDSCVAECRARLFSIDPKRASCIEACIATAARCAQTADNSCRARNLCR